MRHKLLTLLLLLFAFLTGCAGLKKSINTDEYIKKVDLEVVGLKVKTDVITYEAEIQGDKTTVKAFDIDGLGLLSILSSGDLSKVFNNTVMTIQMNIHNPNPVTIVLESFKSDVIIGDKKITEISYNEKLEIQKNDKKDYLMEIAIPNDTNVKELLLGNQITFQGVAQLAVVIGETTTPATGVDFKKTKDLPTESIVNQLSDKGLDLDSL